MGFAIGHPAGALGWLGLSFVGCLVVLLVTSLVGCFVGWLHKGWMDLNNLYQYFLNFHIF